MKTKNIKLILQAIFDYYNLKYNLFCQLDLIEYGSTCFRRNCNMISFNLNYDPSTGTFIKRTGLNQSYDNILIAVLLHELKHAIDYKSGLLTREIEHFVDMLAYETIEGHDSASFEKRADYFALEELKKWL